MVCEPDFRGRDHRRRETPPREAWQVDFATDPCTSNPPCAVACRPWDIAQWEREAVVDRLRSRSAELFIPSDADDTAD
jgi:hypothetical protein